MLCKSSGDEYSYSDPFNAFASNFLPRGNELEEPNVDWGAEKRRGLTLDQLATEVEKGLLESQWFVTGNVDASLFSDAFLFQDDTVSIKDSGRADGLKRYALGVRKLFDQSRSRAEVIGVRVDSGALLVKWRLEGGVNIGPFRPRLVPFLIDTTLTVEEGLVASQVDRFLVPGIQIVLGALIGPWAGPEPAPPIEVLRERFKI